MQYDLPIYTTTKAIEYPRKIHDTSQNKKIHEFTITNRDIINTFAAKSRIDTFLKI